MDLIAIKKYLRQRKIVPIQDLALHFRVDVDTVRPLLAVWISKGKVRKQVGDVSACKGCCQCDPDTIETYQWME